MSEQSTIIALDAAALRSWLLARQLVVVGRSADEHNCPLALFLSEVAGGRYVVQQDQYYPAGMPLSATPLPGWAATFVRSLDCTYPLEQVTGGQALALLPDPYLTSDYCWMHKPGGWTCARCRQPSQADPLQVYAWEVQ